MCRLIQEVTSCGLLAIPAVIAPNLVHLELDSVSLTCFCDDPSLFQSCGIKKQFYTYTLFFGADSAQFL